MRQLETDIEKKFVKEARKLGCRTRKLNGLGQRDWPDQLILVPGGAFLLFEFKRPGEVLRPTQQDWHDDVTEMGFTPHVFDSWQEALNEVKRHL